MSKKSVYLETSFISYLTGRSSRDMLVATHQTLTQQWWASRRDDFNLYISELVILEAQRGDAEAAKRRIAILNELDSLDMSPEVEDFTALLLSQHAVPANAGEDAAHIAVACVSGMDYLLTWNCTHIANAECFKIIEQLSREQGYTSPIICTPEELLGVH